MAPVGAWSQLSSSSPICTDAANDTRLWVEALRKNVDQSGVRSRDVLAIGRTKEKIPAHYQHQTWILSESNLERALSIPRDSA